MLPVWVARVCTWWFFGSASRGSTTNSGLAVLEKLCSSGMAIARKLRDGFWKLVSFRIISYPGPQPSGTESPFIRQEWNRTKKVGSQWNNKISHCLGRGGLMDGEEVSKVTNTSMPLVQWDDGWQKIITANRNRSHATCFQGRCTCLLSRQVGSNPCHLLSRQVPRPLHH